MRTTRFWCGTAAVIAIAAFGGTAIATDDGATDETVEMPAPPALDAEVEATLVAVAAELGE